MLVVTTWLFARCRGRDMAGKPEGDEHSEAPESPRGRTDASGLWVTEDVREADPGGRTHPIYKKLASLSSEVNSMSRGQLKQRLRDLDLEPRLVHQQHNPLLHDSQSLYAFTGGQTQSSANASQPTFEDRPSCKSLTLRGSCRTQCRPTPMVSSTSWCWTSRPLVNLSTLRTMFMRS